MSDTLAKLCADLHVWADAADEGDRIAAHYANGAPVPDVVSQMGADIRKGISALEQANADNARLREALEARERDLSLVLASLRNLEAATEEYLAEEEGVLIGEIEDEQKLRSIHRAAEPPLGALGVPCDWDIDNSGDHK